MQARAEHCSKQRFFGLVVGAAHPHLFEVPALRTRANSNSVIELALLSFPMHDSDQSGSGEGGGIESMHIVPPMWVGEGAGGRRQGAGGKKR